MKRLIKDPEFYFIFGILGFNIVNFLDNSAIDEILLPLFLLIQIIGGIFTIKKYLFKKKL